MAIPICLLSVSSSCGQRERGTHAGGRKDKGEREIEHQKEQEKGGRALLVHDNSYDIVCRLWDAVADLGIGDIGSRPGRHLAGAGTGLPAQFFGEW